jgi:hypothetical protein
MYSLWNSFACCAYKDLEFRVYKISLHYNKSRFLKKLTWSKCPHWPKGLSIFTKGLGHEKTCYIWAVHLTKMTFLTQCQTNNLVKMDKCLSKWPWLNQIVHIGCLGFSQIDNINLTFSQIDYYDLTLSQMSHAHLMT